MNDVAGTASRVVCCAHKPIVQVKRMIRIGIVGCGRILNAHLQGYQRLRELGIDNFRITALCARREEDALMFRRRGEGPPPRPPVLDPSTGDPLAAPHTYLSDFQDDVERRGLHRLPRADRQRRGRCDQRLHNAGAAPPGRRGGAGGRQAPADPEAAGDLGARRAAAGRSGRPARADAGRVRERAPGDGRACDGLGSARRC